MSVTLAEHISDYVTGRAAAWVVDLGFRITAAEPGEVTFELDVRPAQVHKGNVLCGQAIMAAFDTGMVMVMVSLAAGTDDPGRGFTTVSLNSVFERGVPSDTGTVTFHARATRPGRTLVFGQIDCLLPDTRRAATATTTYMWL